MSQTTPAMTYDSVKTASVPISELLESRTPAEVPQYQRPYAWEDEQVTDLINDVKLLLPTPTKSRGHFYGGMVAIKKDDPDDPGRTMYEIVDGQQRLATFCLLLAHIALRAEEFAATAQTAGMGEAAAEMKALAEEIREDFLYTKRFDHALRRRVPRPRVRLSKADHDVFRDLLEGKEVTSPRESHVRLRDAAKALREELVLKVTADADPAVARERLMRLRDAAVYDSFVIHIVGENRSAGYRLFSVLNDRGARLTVADLLRSHTLEILDMYAQLRDQAAEIWDEILFEGGEAVDEFLMAYYTSLTGKRAKREGLFDSLAEQCFDPGSAPGDILGRLQQMATELRSYKRIRNGEWPYLVADQTAQVSTWQRGRLHHLIRTLGHTLSVPLLLSARARCTEEEFATLVQLLEKFIFRYKNICGAHTGPMTAAYYALCRDLRDPKKPVSFTKFSGTLRGLISARANDKIFKAQLSTQLMYNAGNVARGHIRNFLTMIEAHRPWLRQGAKGTPDPSVLSVTDMDQVTIEHIYPQSASPADPSLEPNVNRLGNLTYLPKSGPEDNGSLGNLPFTAKRTTYAASNVSLNQDLAKLTTWDLTALEKREEELINEACLIWVI